MSPTWPPDFGVERRLVQHDLHLDADRRRLGRVATDDQRQHLALGGLGVVAEELGRAVPLREVEPDALVGRLAGAGPGGAGLRLLPGHRRVEAGDVDAAVSLAKRVLGQVEREAEGVVEAEGGVAGQRRALGQALELVVEDAQAAVERGLEAGLLVEQRLLDQRLGARQLGKGAAHLRDERRDETPHHRVLRPEQVGVAHGAAHDPAQHVAAALVRGQDAVGDQERGRAQVVGDHPVVDAARPVGVAVGGVGRRLDQRPHQVGVEVVVLALQDRTDALEPHAGVDRGARAAGRGAPSSCCSNCMKTRFQISMKRSPSSSGLPGGPPGISGPWS